MNTELLPDRAFTNLPKLLMRIWNNVRFWPLLLSATIFVILISLDIYPPKTPHIERKVKGILETIALIVTALAFTVSLYRYLSLRVPFLLWQTCFCAIFLGREIHFTGSSQLIYPSFCILLLVAWYRYGNFKDWLDRSRTISLIWALLFSYLLAVSVDSRWWKGFPNEKLFYVYVEEAMEVIGHLFLLNLALLSSRVSERSTKVALSEFYALHVVRLYKLVPYMLGRIHYSWLLLHVLLFSVAMYCSFNGYLMQAKPMLEKAGVFVAGSAALAAFIRLCIRCEAFFVWYFLLSLNFCLRELHWPYTSEIVYPTVVALMLYAWIRFDRLAVYLAHPAVVTCGFMGFVAYAWSQVLDMRRLPGVFSDRHLMNTPEESMEVLGHLFILGGSVLARSLPETELSFVRRLELKSTEGITDTESISAQPIIVTR